MISVDTSVILSALAPNERQHPQAVQLLRDVGAERPLFVSPVVYAELLATSDPEPIIDFLGLAKIGIVWEMPPEVWELAGRSFGSYARLRRSGSLPRRLVADFLVAAHAEYHGLHVLTFDRTVYDALFPHLISNDLA